MSCCNVCHEVDCECDENVRHYKTVMEEKVKIAVEGLKSLQTNDHAPDCHADEYGKCDCYMAHVDLTLERIEAIK